MWVVCTQKDCTDRCCVPATDPQRRGERTGASVAGARAVSLEGRRGGEPADSSCRWQ